MKSNICNKKVRLLIQIFLILSLVNFIFLKHLSSNEVILENLDKSTLSSIGFDYNAKGVEKLSIESSFYSFEMKKNIINENYSALNYGGGGIENVDEDFKLVQDNTGAFYLVSKDGYWKPIVSAKIPRTIFGDEFEKLKTSNFNDYIINRLAVDNRITDMALISNQNNKFNIFFVISKLKNLNNFKNLCKSLVIYKSKEFNKIDLLKDNLNFQSNDWTNLYETKPCLKAKIEKKINRNTNKEYLYISSEDPIRSNRSGGNIVDFNQQELLLSVGDFNQENLVQAKNNDYGKYLIINKKTGQKKIFAIGSRNSQGMTMKNNQIFSVEHGPRGGDELNLIIKNKNYGWPYISEGTDYEYFKLSTEKKAPKNYSEPLFSWTPSIAPSSIISIKYLDKWKNNFLIGTLGTKSLYRVKISNNNAIKVVERIQINSRTRDISEFNNGSILILGSDHNLALLTPNKNMNIRNSNIASRIDGEINPRLLKIFNNCASCHSVRKGINYVKGPLLYNIFQKKIASENYGYSNTLKNIDGVWEEKNLFEYLKNPEIFAPGTSMPAFNFENDDEINQLINILKKL